MKIISYIFRHVEEVLSSLIKNKKLSPHLTNNVERKLDYLISVFRSIITFRLYSTQENQVKQNYQRLDNYHKTTSNAKTVNDVFRPGPSTSATTNEQHLLNNHQYKIPSGFVAIPNRLEVLYKEQIFILRGLVLAHQRWDESQSKKSASDSGKKLVPAEILLSAKVCLLKKYFFSCFRFLHAFGFHLRSTFTNNGCK